MSHSTLSNQALGRMCCGIECCTAVDDVNDRGPWEGCLATLAGEVFLFKKKSCLLTDQGNSEFAYWKDMVWPQVNNAEGVG